MHKIIVDSEDGASNVDSMNEMDASLRDDRVRKDMEG
jgi:hypothetical protein